MPVLLALPLGNAYGPFASKVKAGAEAATARLQRQGVSIQLTIVDTATSDWVQQVSKAPASTIIGGPMVPRDLPPLLSLTPKRTVFAMMPEFPSQSITEGRAAWRFFTTPEDHIATSLRAAREQFAIKDVGVLYPQEPFGQRRAQLFQTVARGMGMNVKAASGYDPDDPLQWQQQVADFLEAGYTASASASRQPGLQAVYLPDVWAQAQMLVPHFFYFQEDHMLILGSALWGQTLDMQQDDARTFRLSMFPGAWWDDNPSAETRALQQGIGGAAADFWHALGYDFVRMAAHMGPLPAQFTPAGVNTKLQAAQNMQWSMAPMRWDSQGGSRQELFLFSPTPRGPVRADINGLMREFNDSAKRYQSRMNLVQ